jgi:LuxR family maltose regulon positive regulatory protein
MLGGFMTGSSVGKRAVTRSVPRIQEPIPRDDLVVRTRLLGQLTATPDDVPLVLLTAPAGYGKTTVLSQWSAAAGREVAWVTAEAADKDPVRLAGRIARALHRSSRSTRRSSGR